jgi:hypothetical protein
MIKVCNATSLYHSLIKHFNDSLITIWAELNLPEIPKQGR